MPEFQTFPLAAPTGSLSAFVLFFAFVIGHAVHAGEPRSLGSGPGELVDRTLQLLINTLSFAPVGAFALAHAGLSSAVSALMGEAENLLLRAIIFLLGNVLIVVLDPFQHRVD